MIASARSVAVAQASHTWRSLRFRICRVSVGYDNRYASSSSSSHRVRAHRCGSSASRQVTYSTNGPNGSSRGGLRTPGVVTPLM